MMKSCKRALEVDYLKEWKSACDMIDSYALNT